VTSDDLTRLSSRDVAEHAFAEQLWVTRCGAVLEQRAPDESTASLVISAYEGGRTPAWVAAYLLGCLRAPSAYKTVRAILEVGPELSGGVYAGPAMARIAGTGARADLLHLMSNSDNWRTRRGALYGLGELGDASVAPEIVQAARADLVEVDPAGTQLARLRVPTDLLLELFRAREVALRRLALAAVVFLSADDAKARDIAVARAARDAMSALDADPPVWRDLLKKRVRSAESSFTEG
jgi:hypothetical protein